jgi:hypothetical protein
MRGPRICILLCVNVCRRSRGPRCYGDREQCAPWCQVVRGLLRVPIRVTLLSVCPQAALAYDHPYILALDSAGVTV